MSDLPGLKELEQRIRLLPWEDQLWLIERLVHGLRGQVHPAPAALEQERATMAADPEIQQEIRQIENEFAGTEQDSLEKL